jgi:DNA-directed RNA polymerase sigma subunit (sigma70/sigma32)
MSITIASELTVSSHVLKKKFGIKELLLTISALDVIMGLQSKRIRQIERYATMV